MVNNMEQVHKERWTKLFEYLEGVDPSEFNMRSFLDRNKGTRCAAGYLPVVFPQDWQVDMMGAPVLISLPISTSRSICDYLSIDVGTAINLFEGRFRDAWTPLDWIEHAMGVLKWSEQQ